MARLRVVTWNGRDLPLELRELPMGHYVVQPIEIVHELEDDDLELEEHDYIELEVDYSTPPFSFRSGSSSSMDTTSPPPPPKLGVEPAIPSPAMSCSNDMRPNVHDGSNELDGAGDPGGHGEPSPGEPYGASLPGQLGGA
jgi:hypothetical protein